MAARVKVQPATDSAVQVWVAQLPESPCHSGAEDLLAPLPKSLAVRLARFRHCQDLLLRLGGLTLLAHGLQNLAGLDAVTSHAALHYDPQGCPFLSSPVLQQFWQVSFSYAFPWVACALRTGPQDPVCTHSDFNLGLGIDMELSEGTSPLCSGPVSRFAHVFTPAEQGAIDRSADANALVQRWTIKEAVLKALGTGFNLDPHRINTCASPAYASVGTSLHRGDQCATTQQMLHRLHYDQHELFWQSYSFAQGWLSIAGRSPWQRMEISFLRLAQKGHTLLLL